MNVLIFGTTGMVGQGVLRECLLDPGVTRVVAVGRTAAGPAHPKLQNLILADLFAIGERAADLAGFDACFYCLGVTSLGMSEADYSRVTYELTVTIATLLAKANPSMTFVFVSGAGADASGKGRVMWARVKGRAENAVRSQPFKASYVIRPGFIQPLHGIVSKTALYRVMYAAIAPIAAVVTRIAPAGATTTAAIGKAMIGLARAGYSKPILGNADVNQVAGRTG